MNYALFALACYLFRIYSRSLGRIGKIAIGFLLPFFVFYIMRSESLSIIFASVFISLIISISGINGKL